MCTGNIAEIAMVPATSPVYPCVYREHADGQKHLGRIERFIPVCTGNIILHCMTCEVTAVYPCVYREHTNYNILFYN